MPTVLREGPYRFLFVSVDYHEPPHVHIRRESNVAKFWLDPVMLHKAGGFSRHELAQPRDWWTGIRSVCWRAGMSSLAIEVQEATAQQVIVGEDSLAVDLNDGRTIIVPLVWYPRLWYGTPEERDRHEIIGNGTLIHWPDLDEDLSVAGLLAGRRSGESQRSLKRWLEQRSVRGAESAAAATDSG